MRKLMFCSAAMLLAGGIAVPAAAKDNSGARGTCDARYYDDLVGKGVEEAHSIRGSDYRLLVAGAARGAVQPKRMTITFDPGSRQILSVDCG